MTNRETGAGKPDVGFVACIEGGVLEAQALLLFESIRRYAGRFGGCDLYALSPRAGHPISAATRLAEPYSGHSVLSTSST